MSTTTGVASYAFKIIIVGDSNVGKTSIVHRFVHNERPVGVHLTVGVDFGIRLVHVGDVCVKLQLWDTAGQEMYRSIASAYYRNSAGCIAMFDVTNQRSFQSLQQWMRDIRQAVPDARCVVVGNKTDLAASRVVPSGTAKEFASSVEADYAETSVLDEKSVFQTFHRLATRIYQERVVSMDAGRPSTGITLLAGLPPPPAKARGTCQCHKQ